MRLNKKLNSERTGTSDLPDDRFRSFEEFWLAYLFVRMAVWIETCVRANAVRASRLFPRRVKASDDRGGSQRGIEASTTKRN